MKISVLILSNVLLAGLLCTHTAWSQPAGEDPQADLFEKHIRPALLKHCLECHSQETETSGGLNLGAREGWQRGGDLGPAIVPGRPDASLLMQALQYDDPDLAMPPEGKLDEMTIAYFRQWIQDGAWDPRTLEKVPDSAPQGLTVEHASQHWAYRQPQPAPPPTDPNASGPVDAWINEALRQANLQPMPPAPIGQLVRRVAFDLTGLPPDPQQLQRIVQAADPKRALRQWVDELLATPAYGETFARHWMDVARYAESITLRGFVLGEAWRYRDYLIRAYASDLGFDQMVRQQIAGDLLEYDSIEDQQWGAIATGFLALGNTNLETQDKVELDFDHIDEQLEVIGNAFLGQTIGCARCHDHKFDPIPTADYYALAAIFRSTVPLTHANLSRWIEKPLPLAGEQAAHYQHLTQRQQQLAEDIKAVEAELGAKNLRRQYPSDQFAGIVIDDQQAKLVGQWSTSDHTAGYVDAGYRHDANQGKGEKTATFEPAGIPPGQYEVRMSYTSATNRADRVHVEVFSADESKVVFVNQRKQPAIDGIWISLGTYRFEENGQAHVMVSNEASSGHVIIDAVQFLPLEQQTSQRERSEASVEETRAEQFAVRLKQLRAEQNDVKKQLEQRPHFLTIAEGTPVEQLEIRLRGLPHQLGKPVSRGFLTAIEPSQYWAQQIDNQQSGRRQLAEWLVDPRNPLIARVYVNRVWTWLMGAGLVTTPNNFGTTGAEPSHPELLDYLAAELIRSQWSTKHVVRLITSSDAYARQTVNDRDPAVQVDPDNRWYWGSHLKRLPVEAIRDAVLVVSGELDTACFGPTIQSRVNNDYDYQHWLPRRSIYQPLFRNSLPPLYDVFDFPNSSVSVGIRARTTVASQSLAMLNHPWLHQQAAAAAERFWQRAGDRSSISQQEWIEVFFMHALGRLPSTQELEIALSYAESPEQFASFIHAVFASIDFRYLP